MREAPALAAPVRRPRAEDGRKPKATPARKGTTPPSLMRRVFARPGMTVAGAAFAAVMTGIVANAVFFQKGRHPSPLFPQIAKADTAPIRNIPAASEAVTPPAPAVSPDPPVAPAATTEHRPVPDPSMKPKTPVAKGPVHRGSIVKTPVQKASAEKTAQARSRAPAHADPLGSLLGDGKATPVLQPAVKSRHEVAGNAAAPHN